MQKQPDQSFQYLRHLEERTMEFQLGIAKWVIASALLVNGGALVALMSAAKDYPAAASQGGGFVCGVMLGLMTGVFAWLSTACTNEAVTDRLDWEELTVQDPPSADRWDKAANILAVCALISILGSVGSFGVGAWRVEASIAKSAQDATLEKWYREPGRP